MPRATSRAANTEFRSKARSSRVAKVAITRLGRRIRVLRAEKDMSQEKMAERANVDAKHVQAIELGRTNATVATLASIAKALGVPLSVLFEGV